MAVRHDRKVSILDVMGPVMVGPSSSHTAGTARLGRVAREILDEDPLQVRFSLHPPLAATYRGHGSDFALVGGAIGLNVDDPRIPEAIRIAEQMDVTIEFAEVLLAEMDRHIHPHGGADGCDDRVRRGGPRRGASEHGAYFRERADPRGGDH